MQDIMELIEQAGSHLLPVIAGIIFLILILSFVDRHPGSDASRGKDQQKRFPQDPTG